MSGMIDAVSTRVILLYLGLVILHTTQSLQIVWIELGWIDETTYRNLQSSSYLAGYDSSVIVFCPEIP